MVVATWNLRFEGVLMLPLCNPTHATLFGEGRWVPLRAAEASRAACPASAERILTRRCPPSTTLSAGIDRLLEWKPSHCRLPPAVPKHGDVAVQAAIGNGSTLRFIGDSIMSDHYKFFAACLLKCDMQAIPQRCQPGTRFGAPPPLFGNGTRRCEVLEHVPHGQIKFDLATTLRWDWRQALMDAGFASKDCDNAIHHIRLNIQHEQALSGCNIDGSGQRFGADGALIRDHEVAHVDFRCATQPLS